MRLAISNIAWNPSEDEIIATQLKSLGIGAIDIAPGKYFPNPTLTSDRNINRIKDWWWENDIQITGMQALLFGTTGLNIFAPPKIQKAMLEQLKSICHIAKVLEAKKLVFGSPKNRDRQGLSDQETLDIAIPFFRALGDIAEEHGVTICLEPNPVCYGANFMVTSTETARVVELVNHAAIKMQLDTGALTINNEDPEIILNNCSHLIGHIHISEPNLLPVGDDKTNHAKIAATLQKHLPHSLASIEMLATKEEEHSISIKRALTNAIQCYRP
jgi:D-psicose/D-tagatose/L-ribulose 3-epimerase